jgi:hypothetical protein
MNDDMLLKSVRTAAQSEVVSGVVDDAMREHLTRLVHENTELRDRLRKILDQPARMPDDLASAIGHSVDTLQSRLSSLTNQVSSFAVREFVLELKVGVDITPLGTLAYRLPRIEDNIDPARLSTVSMTLVPLPKESPAGSWTQPEFTPHISVEEINGIGETYRRKLNAHQIYTVADLLAVGSRVRSAVELAALLSVDRRRLGEWLAHAQLLTIRGIDGRSAEVLYRIGVRGMDELADCVPDELASRYNAEVERLGRMTLKPVTAVHVGEWVASARAFQGRRAPAADVPAAPTAPAAAQTEKPG